MTIRATPTFVQAGSHPAEETRLMIGGMLGMPPTSFAGGAAASNPAHGIVTATDLAVTQNGTPNMSVNVAAGGCFIRGTASLNQGAYHLWNDATVNLAISAADATNPRRDLVIAVVRDAAYSGASNDARLIVVTGTPAAAPVDPSLASNPNALVLARITVAAGDTAINTADITDLRTIADQRGKIPTFNTSALATTAIPSPVDGQAYYLNLNTTDEGPYWFNGSQYRRPWNMPWGRVTEVVLGTAQTYPNVTWGFPISWTGTPPANRIYRITIHAGFVGGNVGQIQFGVGTAAASPLRIFGIYSNAAAYPLSGSQSLDFTTTGSSMTRGLSVVMATGVGNVQVVAGSVLTVDDVGPSGAPS
jgi:hypothetical protein